MVGESLGAAGALQTVDLIETIRTQALPGIRGLEQPGPELPELNFCRQRYNTGIRSGLINSIGFDGNACSLVISQARI
jgi:3-oxoacyl-(acyl-carrier-protein) synthase